MGWFRAMGAESVAYHAKTVLGRSDDHPGQALDYYGSRGETPLRWGATDAAARLGLTGEVTPEAYASAFGPGGFRHPVTGERLANTKRPGFEIVVAAHKATATLGVIGRAEDMHAILDVETEATMSWLDRWFQAQGGRRGRAAVPAPTSGLVYAQTRHGTSRSGDPAPHDHVLVANVCEMLDARGGHKALFSALLRDTTEAATMVGRLHSAARAVELGYQIESGPGPSGRLRHWRIRGIPAEVCDIFSKRADEITEYLEEKGHQGYRARNHAARATRTVKRGVGVDELMPRWHAELEAAGWSVDRLSQALDAARIGTPRLAPALTAAEIDQLAAGLFDPDGEFLARWKVFSRTRLVAEIAPQLYGHDPAELDHVVDQIIASAEVVPLTGQAVRTLGHEAGIDTSTMRSLLGQLQRRRLTLTHCSVVILDEAAMTDDADLLALLTAVEEAGAKAVLVGDPRQLSPVGPGGAIAATLDQHPHVVTELTENKRQRDPAERAALAQLRHGDIDHAIDFYRTHDRVRTAPARLDALAGMIDAWAVDTEAGHESLMLAWRRDNVAALNRLARVHARQAGQLTGTDLHAPGGRPYAVGDPVVLLAPNHRHQLVTSQRGTVTAIDHHTQTLTLTTGDDGRPVTLTGSEIDTDHLDHGYAMTVHRQQGATVDTAHVFADGGGRELAYVALSRARQRSTLYAAADDLDQALEDIRHDWATSRAQRWVTRTAATGTDPQLQPAVPTTEQRRAGLAAELDVLQRAEPPDVTAELAAARH